MTTPASGPVPADEFVTFIQHKLPGLEDGSYQLTISQHVDDSAGQPVSLETLSRTYTFAVTGDRFALSNPSASVASVFPASNATGEFTTVLPHVVFTAPTFPWARTPTTGQLQLPPVGQDVGTETDVPTWLAVLTLDDDDVAPHGLSLDPVIGVLGDLFPRGVYPDSTLNEETTYTYFSGATDAKGLETGQSFTDAVQLIDLPLQLFTNIAPTLADLELTAHVRQVSVENKPMALGAQPPDDPIGTFAIVIGNRLPQQDKQSHAYLVSLESLEDYLPATGDGGTTAKSGLVMANSLRLAVLQHWTFNTKGETAAFVKLVSQLNGRTGSGDATNTNLRLAVADAQAPISTALAGGYVPLNHGLRTGEKTVSWYRGPLSPIDRARAGPDPLPVSSPDQVLVFDPTTGMFDASLAAAWTIGRLVALQDQSYSTSLYGWKKGQAQSVVDTVERQIIDDALGGLIATPAGATPAGATPADATPAGATPADATPAGATPAGATPSTATLLHDTMRLIKSAGAP